MPDAIAAAAGECDIDLSRLAGGIASLVIGWLVIVADCVARSSSLSRDWLASNRAGDWQCEA